MDAQFVNFNFLSHNILQEMRGTYQYPDGSEYKGEWSGEGQREGYGVMKFTDGSQYYGMFKAGLCHGLGVMIFGDGSRYIY